MTGALILLLALAADPAARPPHEGHPIKMDMKAEGTMATPKAKPRAEAVRRSERPGPKTGSTAHSHGHDHGAPAAAAPSSPHHGTEGMAMAPSDTAPPATEPIKPEVMEGHQGHDMAAMAETAEPPVSAPPPSALAGPAHAADRIYGEAAMEAARSDMRAMHGDIRSGQLLVDQAEMRFRSGQRNWYVKAQAWYGGDIDRLRIKAEGEGRFGGKTERGEIQALWSHALDPWFNLQSGLRVDIRPGPGRAWLSAGIEGLAPYGIHVEASAFLAASGALAFRAEGEYDLRLTRRLILQPRAELNFASRDLPRMRIGSGLSTLDAGLRLRYQPVPEFAPYIGLGYERAFGDSAAFRHGGERGKDRGWSMLLGIRTWF